MRRARAFLCLFLLPGGCSPGPAPGPNVERLMLEAKAFLKDGKPREAIDRLDQALAAGAETLQVLKERGAAHLSLGDLVKAAEDYSRVATGAPGDAEAQYQLGVIRSRQGRLEDSLAAFTAATLAAGDLVKAHVNRSSVLYQLGRVREAIQAADRAIELDPYDASFRVNRGIYWTRLGDRARARADFDEAIRRDPQFVGGYYSRGVDHGAHREFAEAASDMTHVLELRPDYVDARLNRAAARGELGEHEAALEDLELVLGAQPRNPEALEARVASLRALGRTSEADAAEALLRQVKPAPPR